MRFSNVVVPLPMFRIKLKWKVMVPSYVGDNFLLAFLKGKHIFLVEVIGEMNKLKSCEIRLLTHPFTLHYMYK